MCAPRHSKRAWCDQQMYTHAAFVPGVCIALLREPPMLELVVLQSIVCAMSLWYHRNHEFECAMAQVEHRFAETLFAYGAAQTLLSPSIFCLAVNLACANVTTAVFVATHDDKALWEKWHAVGLHVVPGIWSTVIASWHEPIAF
jgi:hypothetical protein